MSDNTDEPFEPERDEVDAELEALINGPAHVTRDLDESEQAELEQIVQHLYREGMTTAQDAYAAVGAAAGIVDDRTATLTALVGAQDALIHGLIAVHQLIHLVQGH